MLSEYQLALLGGLDLPIQELGIVIHPPSIKDIAHITEEKFFSAVQYLCLDKEALFQDETVLDGLDNFQVFMKVIQQSQDKSKKTAIVTVLGVLFPDYRPVLTPASIVLTNLDDATKTVMIDSRNFEILQEVIKEVLCLNNMFQGQNVVYNPANAEAKRIADKLMRGRKKVAELKQNSGQSSVLGRYVSILAIGEQYTLDYCYSLTLYQLFDLIERYMRKVEWDIDLQVRLTGTTPKSEVKNWMDDVHQS